MLSFDADLTNALKNSNTTAFWVLKLYYNDESAFIGVSDRHRQDGTDIYYGIVASWGVYRQSLDFFNFTTSTANMSVTLINQDKSIKGGRFTDLFATNNFENRKWELFLNTNETATLDTAARMIGTGVISGEVDYDHNNIVLSLLDNKTRFNKRIPSATVDSSTYPNAPENNIGKPIPMAFGDFYEKTDIGTIPTTHFDRFKKFYKGAFPAIITDRYDVGVEGSEAKADNQALHTLDNENVYYYKSKSYATLTDTVDATTNNPVIEFSGSRCKSYFPLSSSGFTTSGTGTHTNEANVSNGDFSDSSKTTIAVTDGNNVTINYGIDPLSKLGEFVSVKGLSKFGTISGSLTGLNFLKIGGVAYTNPTSNDELESTLNFTTAQESAWDFTGGIPVLLNSSSGNKSVEISEMGLVVEFDIDEITEYQEEEIFEGYRYAQRMRNDNERIGYEGYQEFYTYVIQPSIVVPAKIDYVYYSGKGRIYDAWVDADSRNNGYNQNDLIENPIYIIESVLREELSLSSSNIDYSTFDASGNTTNGNLGSI